MLAHTTTSSALTKTEPPVAVKADTTLTTTPDTPGVAGAAVDEAPKQSASPPRAAIQLDGEPGTSTAHATKRRVSGGRCRMSESDSEEEDANVKTNAESSRCSAAGGSSVVALGLMARGTAWREGGWAGSTVPTRTRPRAAGTDDHLLHALNEQLAEVTEQLLATTHELAESRADLSETSDQLADKTVDLSAAEARINELSAGGTVDDLVEQLNVAKAHIEQLERSRAGPKEVHELKDKVAQLEAEAETRHATFAAAQRAAQSAIAEESDLRAGAVERLERMEKALAGAESRAARRVSALEARLRRKDEIMAGMRKKIAWYEKVEVMYVDERAARRKAEMATFVANKEKRAAREEYTTLLGDWLRDEEGRHYNDEYDAEVNARPAKRARA